jgi:predicted transcriptional regulator
MEASLAEVEFLALSENRVEVLRLLADGPHDRSELAVETGASQATLGRILRDFEERSWVERREGDGGGEYVATATGRLVSHGFTDLLDILATERELRGVVEYLPDEELTFDLRHLSDATVTLPSGTRPDAPLQRLVDFEREAAELRAFSHAFNERSLSVTAERARDGELRFRGVFSRGAIDALANDDELRETLRTLLDAEDATVRVYDGEIPLAGSVVDGVVNLLVRDEKGVLQAAIDTDDEVVLAWAEDRFRAYWEAAAPFERRDLWE